MIHRFQLTTLLVTCASAWERRAMGELKRALPGCTCRPLFMPGNLLCNTEAPRDQTLTILDDLETTVVGRIVPLDLRADIVSGPESLDLLLVAAQELKVPEPGGSFRVVCHRRGEHEFGSREVEHYVGERLADLWELHADLDLPDQVLSIEIFQHLAFLSLCWPEELLRKEIVQMRRSAERPLNRSELKLREALECFHLALTPDMRALDLGAAPGGWTRVLAATCREVVAVDPALLDDRVHTLPNVIHVTARAENYLRGEQKAFDIVTCDMNLSPLETAGLMKQAGQLLPESAPAIMTIKFQTRQRRKHVEEVLATLEGTYRDFAVQHLPHNGLETTLFMRRAAP
jgi:23S rRNA (cytidine2498-2'-O)-methyltransferase